MRKTRFRNGMRHSKAIKEKAIQLRRAGQTHREIARTLHAACSTVHLWTKGVKLSEKQRMAILARAVAHAFPPERRARLSALAKLHWAPPEKYTKEDLLKKITDFYERNGRIPLKREFNMFREYKRCFGGWNRAIRAAGFATNPELFAHKFTARDGHRCDSFTEMIIDNWLKEYEIKHERNWKYGTTKMTADFFIQPNIIVEFFGLAGVQKNYDKIVLRKKDFCERHGYELIALYPRDLFSKEKNSLARILGKLDVRGMK